MKQLTEIFKLFQYLPTDHPGFTRADVAYILFGTNEQHRVCSCVKELIDLGLLKPTGKRGVNPLHPTSTGALLVCTDKGRKQ